MKVLKPQKLSLLTRCYEKERHFHLGVAVLSLHRFSQLMSSEADLWKFLSQELGKEGCPDAGMPKSRAEFLVTGSAFQADGVPRPTCVASVRLGQLEKTLYISGDRQWRYGLPSEPLPFVEMPLKWEYAFGGSGYPENPLGKGNVPIDGESGPLHPLPNLELPGHLVGDKKDRPPPACFGPIDLMWPQRSSKAGTHDAQWLKECFPGPARDMDGSIHNLASEDQQQAAFFRGDEAFSIRNMHPRQPTVEGRLPGITARCFAYQQLADGNIFREVGMNLTTVWFFPHAERFLLVFHGSIEVAQDDAADVLHLMIGAEEGGKPKPVEHYQQVREKRLDPDKGAIHALRDEDLLPDLPALTSGKDTALAQMQALMATEGLLRKNRRVFTEKQIEKSRAMLVSLGLDPDLHGPSPLPPDEPEPGLEDLPDMAEKLIEEGKRRQEEEKRRRAQKEKELHDLLSSQGLDADAIVNEPHEPVVGPPLFSADQEIEKLRLLSADSRARGCPVEELEQYAKSPRHRQMLDEMEQNLRENYRKMAHHQDPAPRFSGEDAARARKAALDTLQSRGNLARQNLTGFDLSGLDLRGVDLSEAWMENANLSGCNLSDANLSRAVLARADLTDARLDGADLSLANLGLAQMQGVRAKDADFSEAILGKAHVSGASLQGARFDGADLYECQLAESDFSGASLKELHFIKTHLKKMVFVEADLSGSNFLETRFDEVDFGKAKLEAASFFTARGTNVSFAAANMANCRFVQGCRFDACQFPSAELKGANLRGTSLVGANLSHARLVGADLSECLLGQANLYRIFARNALFVKTDLSGAVLLAADLMNALLQKADLRGADLRGANLFQADLARVWADTKTDFKDANMKKVRVNPTRMPA
jgi:uncharacterized protein YjbI with pentapeptide repeats